MSRYQVRVVSGPVRDPRFADATGVGLRVERDGARYQFFALVISGQEFRLDHANLTSQPGFWAAAVEAAARELPQRVLDEGVPLDDPTSPIDLRVDFGLVEQLIGDRGSLPSIEHGAVVASWEE